MTQTEKHTDFTTRLMPRLKRIARMRFRKKRDSDDRTADLIARGWEAYGHSINRGQPPSLRAVLRGANKLWRRSNDLLDQPSVKVSSLSEPSVHRAVACISA